MADSRVAVTGLGIICGLGRDQREFWARATEGQCGIRKLSLFDATGCLSDLASQVDDPQPPANLARFERRRASRTDMLCLIAAEEAVAQAGLTAGGALARFGVSLGSSTSGMLEAEGYCRDGLRVGFDRLSPSRVLRLPTSAPTDTVARRHGASGPRVSNMTACASSAASIGFAADLIRSGDAPGMIAGGGDALCLMTYAGFNALRLLDPDPCRPFDATRQGLSLGEGAGILVLEDWDHAAARGAPPLAEFLDYGASCDASHMTAPHPEGRGAAWAMAQALQRSGLSPSDIGHINAHGTGTSLNDATEAKAILSVFGPELTARVPVTSTKSQIGHLLGGSGGAEAVTLVLSLIHQALPPTLGWTTPDEGVPLNLVVGAGRRLSFEYGLSNSFGFGGTNCSLVFRRCP
jgi:3-oxoacyl-[acyl-carrier-protein] synthase II